MSFKLYLSFPLCKLTSIKVNVMCSQHFKSVIFMSSALISILVKSIRLEPGGILWVGGADPLNHAPYPPPPPPTPTFLTDASRRLFPFNLSGHPFFNRIFLIKECLTNYTSRIQVNWTTIMAGHVSRDYRQPTRFLPYWRNPWTIL